MEGRYGLRVRTAIQDLSAGEWAVLALLAERPAHGFAIARAMAADGEIGRVWTLPRPLVYRALDKLAARGLAEEHGIEPGSRGPRRTILAPTRRGRSLVRRWLVEPVDHVRDVRSLFMLKLLFLGRAGQDPSPLLAAQREHLLPVEAALAERAPELSGYEHLLALWRLESSRAVLRFIAAALAERGSEPAS
jgi:PadR family transcriptional regulator AphA